METFFLCRYRNLLGKWTLIPIRAIDADAARVKCSQRHGHCTHAWAV